MEWFMYLIGAITLGAVILAFYEKRKGRESRHHAAHDVQMSEREVHTHAERIRTEGIFLPGSSNGPH